MRLINYVIILFLSITSSLVAQPKIEANTEEYDFGRVPQNVTLIRKLILRSVGDAPVQIDSVITYCDCIEIPIKNMTLMPGDSLVTELRFKSSFFSGNKEWRPHFYINKFNRGYRLRVMAFVVDEIKHQKRIFVDPHTVNASQFGDNAITRFPIKIYNNCEENVPFRLTYAEDDYFTLDFPTHVAPKDSALGWINLNQKGLENEFETAITFEYLNEDSETRLYSIPIKRKIFKPEN
nr:DUF1573 domain-containing protein [candidate division Zixibacteria bacterium]